MRKLITDSLTIKQISEPRPQETHLGVLLLTDSGEVKSVLKDKLTPFGIIKMDTNNSFEVHGAFISSIVVSGVTTGDNIKIKKGGDVIAEIEVEQMQHEVIFNFGLIRVEGVLAVETTASSPADIMIVGINLPAVDFPNTSGIMTD